MQYQFIFEFLYGRIAGTGIHLSEKGNRISYKELPVRGIKIFLKYYIRTIYEHLIDVLPSEIKKFDPKQLILRLQTLGTQFEVSLIEFESQINIYRNDKSIWDQMDNEQQSAFILNAFFTAFEQSREEKNRYEFEALGPMPNFQQANFCFVFRAREYVRSANEKLYNNAFANLAERLNRFVYDEYRATFLHMETPIKEKESGKSDQVVVQQHRDLIQKLKSANTEEILTALNEIERIKLIEAIEPIEYLLNNSNDQIQERALEVIMKLKGEEI